VFGEEFSCVKPRPERPRRQSTSSRFVLLFDPGSGLPLPHHSGWVISPA
jgi:hypothetical protein